MPQDFQEVKIILEEYLQSINENSSEIQSLFDYLAELEHKIERLNNRLDQLQLNQEKSGKPSISPLTHPEKKVFLVLYTEEIPLSYYEIAAKANLPLAIVQEIINALGQKNLPLQRTFINNQVFFKLDSKFKDRQAKEQLVNLSLQAFLE